MENQNKPFIWYSDVIPSKVDWLWYPFFPCGKISVVQGDPGCGKSLLMMDVIARLTTGRTMPDGKSRNPINVIYQCSEDGREDTIRPRLERAGADCSRVAYINEDICSVTLDDEIIRKTIISVDAKLLVIDPFQAYLGDSDLSNASRMRRIMRTLGVWASAFNCAIVLVGHLNKKTSQNELYRGLGSVDIMALARSVIQVEKSEEESSIRYYKQVKNSLSSVGPVLSFMIDRNGKLEWISDITDEKNDGHLFSEDQFGEKTNGKTEAAALALFQILSPGPVAASSIVRMVSEKNISERTIKHAKKIMGVVSFRKNGQWYWSLPNSSTARIRSDILDQSAEDLFNIDEDEDGEEAF